MNRSLVAAVAVCTLLVGNGVASADQLIEAAESGDVELVRQLIDGGADLNKLGRFGAALHRALAKRHDDVVALLVVRGADVNVANPLAGTPLHVAAATGNEAMVLLLLEHGASLTVARGSDGYTPLHVAAEAGRTRVVRLLLDRGADVNWLTHGRSGLRRCTWRSCAATPRWHKCCGRAARRRRRRADRDPHGCGERRARASGREELHVLSRRRPGGQVPHGRANALGSIWPRAGSLPGFEYSSALQRLGGVWDEEALNAFVAHPLATAPGTRMRFEGLANAEERADLIAYLRALSDAPSPAPR